MHFNWLLFIQSISDIGIKGISSHVNTWQIEHFRTDTDTKTKGNQSKKEKRKRTNRRKKLAREFSVEFKTISNAANIINHFINLNETRKRQWAEEKEIKPTRIEKSESFFFFYLFSSSCRLRVHWLVTRTATIYAIKKIVHCSMWRLHQSNAPVWIQVSLQRRVALISKYKYDDTHLLPFSIKQHCY